MNFNRFPLSLSHSDLRIKKKKKIMTHETLYTLNNFCMFYATATKLVNNIAKPHTTTRIMHAAAPHMLYYRKK